MARTPFTDTLLSAGARGLRPARVGLIAIVLTVLAIYFAYSQANPFARPYEFAAIFNDINDLKPGSPVRIAGVTVGEVSTVEQVEDGSGLVRVTMKMEERGLPLKEDAELKVRHRIFLEGNYFVDVQPGTPSAPELERGDVIPPNQTASPVQFGEILTALQTDTREDLRTFLQEYAQALRGPGAEGFRQALRHWEEAYRNTALVNQATLGTETHDLSRLLRGQGRAFGALARDEEALMGLIVHLNRTAAAFAREDDALKATIPQLRDVLKVGRPALQSLNDGLPSLRAFARDALPGARSSSPTLDAQLPFIQQARQLVSKAELRGLASDLRATVPALVRLNLGQTRTLAQTRALASCQNRVLLPFSKTPIPHPFFSELQNEPFFEQSPRSFVGLAGESRLADANSPYFRTQAGGGATTIFTPGQAGEDLFAQLDFPLSGIVPLRPDKQPSFRPDVPCETQEAPNLEAPSAGPGFVQEVNPMSARSASQDDVELAEDELAALADHLRRLARGLPSVDPLAVPPDLRARAARELGLKYADDGALVEDGSAHQGNGGRGTGGSGAASDEPSAERGTRAEP